MEAEKDWKGTYLDLFSNDESIPGSIRQTAINILSHPNTRKAYRLIRKLTSETTPNNEDFENDLFGNAIWTCAYWADRSKKSNSEFRKNRFIDSHEVWISPKTEAMRSVAGNRDLALNARDAAKCLMSLIYKEVTTGHEGIDLYNISYISRRNQEEERKNLTEEDNQYATPIIPDKDIMISLINLVHYFDFYATKKARGRQPNNEMNCLLLDLNDELKPMGHAGIQRNRIFDAIGLLVRVSFEGKGPRAGKTTQKVIERLQRNEKKENYRISKFATDFKAELFKLTGKEAL